MISVRRSLLFVVGIAFTIALVCSPATAQVAIGNQPFGSFGGGPELINLGNLNVHYTIPIRHKTGRGNDFSYDLNYDSSVWAPVGTIGSQSWQLATPWGWQGLNPAALSYVTYSMTYTTGQCGYQGQSSYQEWIYSNFVYVDQFGVKTTFGGGMDYYNSPGGGTCPPNGAQPPTVVPITVGGYTLYATPGPGNVTGYVIDKSGTSFYPSFSTSPPTQQGAQIFSSDHNSNSITVNNGAYIDTLNTPVLTVTKANNTNLSYTAPSGATATYVVSYKLYTVRTNFGCGNITEYNSARTSQANLVDRVTLPDNSYYQFNYETTYQDSHTPHDVTGRVASVTLPSGGTISYVYSAGTTGVNEISCADGTATTLVRTTPDTGSNSWTYARTQVSGTHWQTKVTDPTPTTSNQTVFDFQQDSTPTGHFYETQRLVYQGSTSGTLLDTITTCYNSNTSNCSTTAVGSPISQQYVATKIGTSNLQGLRITNYNSNGLFVEEDDYDYAQGVPTIVLKKILTTYASLGNIVNLPATITTCSGTGTSSSCNGTGTVVAQTTFSYDQTALTASSGTPQHNCASNGCAGNVTTIANLVQGTTTLSQTYTHYDTGTVKTFTDVNGAVTTFNYPDANSTCGNAFPTGVTSPIVTPTLSRSYVWNCSGAVATQVTDENGRNSTITYSDPYFWRPASQTDATNAVSNICYGLYTGGTCAPNANQVEVSLNLNSGNSTVDNLTTKDWLGRVHLQQRRQSPSSTQFDTVETDYDALGRSARITVPYSGTAGQISSTAPATTTTYDGLNRPLQVTDGGNGTVIDTYSQNDLYITIGPAPTGENTKRRQLEFNGLGQLTSVCEVTSATPSGACGQNTVATGYLTKYAYDPLGNLLSVSQNAQPSGTLQTRSYSYDGLSRLISETNPEIGPSTGPTPITYAYDSATGCTGPFNGDLVKRQDPVGNVSCYAYDALHRGTSVTYSGPYMGVTPNKYFVYNSATVNGLVMVNVKNRLAEAYTATTPNGTKITDEGFSYTARGEVSDVYQLTPHSNSTYYHVLQTYWPHGGLFQLSADIAGVQISGMPPITYGGTIGSTVGLDGEGRTTQVTASGTGQQSPVTGVSYNVASLPTQVTFGSGDSDVFSYDPNTFRMSQYQFNVNSQQSKGQLTWNANSTLEKLVITDPYNSTDNQTCNYAYDDVTRVASANCGTAAAQTFTYDPFGNIYKSGAPYSFQPTYSSRNRMTSLPGNFTPTYDNNGNVTNDSNHTYGWDADGNSVMIDTVGLTFDALDRMVEQKRSNTYTEIIYSPTGAKLALMGGATGQTLQKAFVSLPGQATVVYTNSGLDHYRHSDWLGSARMTSSPTHTFLSSVAYAPFGESYAQSGTADLSFTGENQDTVTGDYDFLYREYSNEGRWISPDPAGLAVVAAQIPQTWNRYAYVSNNPLGYTDPYGLFCQWDDGTSDDIPGNGGADGGTCYDQGGTWISLCGIDTICVTTIDQVQPIAVLSGGTGRDSSWWTTFFSGLTFSIRAPGQTLKQCLAQNSGNYSIAGLAGNDNFFLGNDVANIAFGDSSEGTAGLIAAEGGSRAFDAGVGTVLTAGRRTASITSLNLQGVRGPAPRILAKTAAGKVAGVLSGAAELKLAIDIGLTGAEVIGCLVPQ